MELNWIQKSFNQLTPQELYAILRLRSEVFVVEQNCVFQDMDNKDQHCVHLLAMQGDALQAYSRIVPPGISFDEPSIGRVITSPRTRGTGMGRVLMAKAIEVTESIYGKTPIRIGAQAHLDKFYGEFGFVADGGIYDEDGIDHVIMVRL